MIAARNRLLLSALTFTAAFSQAAPKLEAQSGATSIPALVDRSDTIVVARPLGSEVINGRKRWHFVVSRTLSGTSPRRFTLEEPEGRACGRALSGLLPGLHHIAFLRSRGEGDPKLVISGAAALPKLSPALEEFVQDLLATEANSVERVQLLADAIRPASASDPMQEHVDASALSALSIHPRLVALDGERWSQLRSRARTVSEARPDVMPSVARLLLREGSIQSLSVLAEFAESPRPTEVRAYALRCLHQVPTEQLALVTASLPLDRSLKLTRALEAVESVAEARRRFRSIRPGNIR